MVDKQSHREIISATVWFHVLDLIHNQLFQILRGIQYSLIFIISIGTLSCIIADPDIIGLFDDENNRND